MASPEAMVSQHDLVYENPPRLWEDGFPIGNGHFGAIVWQPEDPDRIVFGITKLDVWDNRFEEHELVPFQRFRELCKTDPVQAAREVANDPPYDAPYPCPKPCGRLAIGIDETFFPLHATLFQRGQRLCLHTATVDCDYEVSTKAVRTTAFMHADSNVLAIRVENTWVHDRFRMPHRQPIVLSREIDETLGMPQTGAVLPQQGDGRVLFIRYPFPDGFEYVMALLVSGAPTTPPTVFPDQVRTEVVLPPLCAGPVYTLYLTVVTSKDSPDPMATALANLDKAEAVGFDALHAAHREWWTRFWECSGVELQDRFLEALWYFSVYQLASTCRGDTAPGLFGLWNMTKSPPWHGDYHGDYNISMAHWFLFSSNHLELGEPYFKTFSKILPKVKQQTKDLYQIDGAKYPIATGPDTGLEMTRHYYRMMLVSSAYYAIPFWWHYLYSRDRKFLADVTFPILEESSKFYLALVERTDSGLVIGPSWAPEQGPLPAYNVNNDLGLIRSAVWAPYVEACRVLGRETPWLKQVVECLAAYPEYPQASGRFLDSAGAPEDLKMAHTGLFAMVYPGGDVDADHPLAKVAARTVDTFHERSQRLSFVGRQTLSDVLGWTTRALASARLRRPERVDAYLMEGLSEYVKPNGMFTILSTGVFHSLEAKRAAYDFGTQARAEHVLIATASSRYSRDRHFQFIEGPSAFVCILNEMMLQSHRGVLRIFPAVPARIADCAFRDLRAEGAFLVSARCRGGSTKRVDIESLAGEPCTVRLFRYNGADAVRVSGPDSGTTVDRIAPDTWRFPTVPGGRYALCLGEVEQPVQLEPSGQPAGVKWMLDPCGNKVFYGKAGGIE